MKEVCSPDSCHFEIKIQGHLSGRLTKIFNGLEITLTPDGHTILTGRKMDQSALFGVLIRIRDIGIPLLSVVRIDLKADKE